MPFSGLPDAQARADLMVYLKLATKYSISTLD
jgi:hypothetical protein